MQKKGANISLKGYDDIFSTDQSRAEAQQERVQLKQQKHMLMILQYCAVEQKLVSQLNRRTSKIQQSLMIW